MAGKHKGTELTVGTKVKLRSSVLLRHSKSVPAHSGFTTEGFAWRKTLDRLEGKIGIITMVFPNSNHVNVTFGGTETIGIEDSELVVVGGGSGWKEAADQSGKAPRHRAVARKSKLKDTERQPMVSKIERAREFGRQAARDGKMLAPAQDKHVLELMAGNEVRNPENIPIMKAWREGWAQEIAERNKPAGTWKYYSVYDKQTGRYMATGKNSKSYKEAVEDIVDYLNSDSEDDDKKLVEKMSFEEKTHLMKNNGFEVEGHNDPMEEDDE